MLPVIVKPAVAVSAFVMVPLVARTKLSATETAVALVTFKAPPLRVTTLPLAPKLLAELIAKMPLAILVPPE